MWDREMRGNDRVKHLSRVCFPCYEDVKESIGVFKSKLG